ncbi:MAG: hypothetical protein ACO3SO_02050 [Luteolibacter sp.]
MRILSPTLLPLFVACFSLCIQHATAQAPMVELKFITFPQSQEPLEMELVVSEDKTLKLEIPSNELSETYRVPRLSKLVFGESEVDDEGKFKFNIFGQGAMASGKKQIVLILRKGKELSAGFQVRALSSDTDAFGGGKFLFLNATSKPISGIAGKQRFALKSGNHSILKPVAEREDRLTFVEFYYFDQEQQPVNFFKSWWPVDKNTRGLIFFYQDPMRDNKITFHSYRDFLIKD